MIGNEENKKLLPKSLTEIENYMKERAGLGKSFDLGVRKLKILRKDVHFYYVNGLCETAFIIEILEELNESHSNGKLATGIMGYLEQNLAHQSVEKLYTMEKLVLSVLSGLIVFVMEGEGIGLSVDTRGYPGRQPQEPDTEKVVRGSRDGFVENIILNTALTRRRIRDERLRFELIHVGKRSKTDIAIGYIENVANPLLVSSIRKELEGIKVDGLPMADKTIEEFIVRQGFNPYPLVRYTERADVASVHLLEGHVLIYVDTSPSVIITPATYFHHVQHAEEYRQSPAVGTFVRWCRFLGILSSIVLLPLWYLFVVEPGMLPEHLSYIGPNEKSSIPIFVQLLLADLGIEFLRIAAIHTPTPLSTAMGLIAAILIGQIAIDVGLFVPEVILYVAVSGIGTFTTPSYELSVANKIVRFMLLIVVAIFHTPGFVIATTIYLLFLIQIKTFGTPYFWPFVPFEPKACMQILIRRAVPGSILRPKIMKADNRTRQSAK
ncbi:spore germination protein [Neobacillus notoginsengisoli]|uniref:Spore germination protein n=1 Tax=Neobacillus notoginsengisoli TaxID=1578198 RepID=A0A417YV62_9BACI|nr:spore germination protein [Neobacillus notoginsengisoli]RHW41193.1 spore germination protein [Neobacillus notoginsengisoli]